MRPQFWSIPMILLTLAAGCGDDTPAKPKLSRETIGKKTDKVLKLQDALQNGGVLADTGVPVADPLTQNAAVYRTSVAKIGAMAIESRIQTRNALNAMEDPKPLTYEQFMDEIIQKGKPDAVQLAMLPYYQEYAWDEANQKLVVVEFPAKKKEFQDRQDKELGRK